MSRFLLSLPIGIQLWLLATQWLALSRSSGLAYALLAALVGTVFGAFWALSKAPRRKLDPKRRARRLLSVVLGNLSRGRRHFVLAGVGIVVGIATFVFFIALGGGVREIVLGEIFPIDQLEVVPPRVEMSIGPLQIDQQSTKITDELVNELRAVPGVKAVYPKMKITFPARAWGGKNFLGKNAGAEIIGDGVDPALVADDVAEGFSFDDLEGMSCADDAACGSGATCGANGICTPKSCSSDAECGPGWYCDLGDPDWKSYKPTFDCHRPIPVLISTRLFELLNNTFLPANGIPKVSRDFLIGRVTFLLYLGYSALGAADQGRLALRRVVIVGFSPRAISLGLTFPLQYVKRWNREYSGEDKASAYTSALIEVESKDQVTAVAAAIKDKNLSIEDSGAEQAGLVITIITLIFSLISVTIIFIAAINIMHTFFMLVSERRREIGILRSLGASRADIRGLLLAEAALVGLLSGLVGVALAYDMTLLVDWLNTTSLVPDFPFKPQSYFIVSPTLIGGALLFAIGCCVFGAFLPARAAAAIDPARALTAS